MGKEEFSKTGNWFTDDDMDFLRYYYYIMHGVDNDHIPPMENATLNNILKLVPHKWQRKFKETLSQVIKEAIDDYKLSVKKSIVDFVLQDPLINESNSHDQVFENYF